MIEIKTLDKLFPGERGIIVKVGGNHSLHHRILSMGLTGGTEVEVERSAPLGDPIEIKVLGYHLSLRKEEAKIISVEVNMLKQGAFSLMRGKKGEKMKLFSMAEGVGFRSRLAKIGLERGTIFKIIYAGGDGPITILVGDKKEVLGSGMVKKMFVKKLD